MKSFVALSVILLATSASSSTTSIPLTKLQGTGAYLKGSPDAGRARAAFLRRRTDNANTVPATYKGYPSYVTKVGIGNPPTYYNLIVDTASANTFCGTGTPYVRTSTSAPTNENVHVNHEGGSFTGQEYTDQVTLAPNLVIAKQSIGDVNSSAGLDITDGTLGLGPRDLTLGTLSPDSYVTIPTVMNNLVLHGHIQNEIFGIYFAPPSSNDDTTLTYGGTNSSLYKGNLTWVPVTKTLPASRYWGVDVTLCTYGNHTVIPTSTAGIVDSGTTLVLFADDFFSVYMKAIQGASMDPNTGLLEIPRSSISRMQPLNFTLADRVFSLDVAAQLFPADQNTAWGGVPEKRYGTVGSFGNNSRSGEGLDFLLGLKFLERYYSAFDADGNRVGFAQTNHTFSTYEG